MERMLPAQNAETMVRGGSGALRGTFCLMLVAAVAGGGWLRFNGQIANVLPSLAAPESVLDQRVPGKVAVLVELAMLPDRAADAAVTKMQLPAKDAGALLQALRDGRLRLTVMPLIDASTPSGQETSPAHTVVIRAGGYTQTVVLTRTPVDVPMPIGPVGEVTFTSSGPGPLNIGMLGLTGQVRLPDMSPGDTLGVGVVAE